MSSFIEHFASLPDPRIERTRLHKLGDILFITIAAVLSGCDDWNEIELYGESKEEWLRRYLELPNGIPSHDTFNRVFSLLAPEALRQCFFSWVQEVARLTEGEVGKRSIIHMVSAWSGDWFPRVGTSKGRGEKLARLPLFPPCLTFWN